MHVYAVKKLNSNASLIKEILGKSTSVTDLYMVLLKQFYAQAIMMSTIPAKKFVRVLPEKLKISVDPILYSPSAQIHCPSEFVMSNTFLCCFLDVSTIEATNDIRHTCTPQTTVLLLLLLFGL
jgi:hypothetical protein